MPSAPRDRMTRARSAYSVTRSVLLLAALTGSGVGSAQGEPAEGFTIFAPLRSTTMYMIDLDGVVLHTWPGSYNPGNAVYLLDNGNLLRTIHTSGIIGGSGGGVQEVAWDGTVVWDFRYDTSYYLSHHDVEVLPNGNLLMIAWEYLSTTEAIAQGRNPAYVSGPVFAPDHVIEVERTGPTSGDVVWEWHAWDHLVQDYDPTKPNIGVVADHPELIDLNFPVRTPTGGDWLHLNGIDYHEELDQILLSCHNTDEIWIIDHSTTTAEAAGHTGGNSGRGGDLLYRWGNPQAYGRGTSADQQFYGQHDGTWIEDGYPGAGNILVFNNGSGMGGPRYSSVEEIVPPVDASGNYALAAGATYDPAAPVWDYTAPNPPDFYSSAISGASRLSNGNTLICSGNQGWFFEVTAGKDLVWEYVNAYPSLSRNSVFKVRRYEHYLFADAESLSASSGGSVGFQIAAGSEQANRLYFLAASFSGTEPGTPLPGAFVTIPLNSDSLTLLVLTGVNGPNFVDFFGTLDGSGGAEAELDIPGPLDPALVGLTAHFAYALFPPWDFASNATAVEIIS